MEVSQFTYFQQVAGFECRPVAGELTYGLERLAMYVQGVENVYALNFNGREGAERVSYGDIFLQAEQEYSRHNFEYADTDMLFAQFKMAEGACRKYLDDGWKAGHNSKRHFMALPAYDQCIKASHVFNLLDARGVISSPSGRAISCACASLPRRAARRGSRPKREAPHERAEARATAFSASGITTFCATSTACGNRSARGNDDPHP